MTLVIQLSGYDKRTELIADEHLVPAHKAARVKQIAAVAQTDPDVLGAYPLTEAQANQIAGEINEPIIPGIYDWFLQGYEE